MMSQLILDQFGSHVFRSILLLLHPSLRLENNPKNLRLSSKLRSKKSLKWKSQRPPLTSLFPNDNQEIGSTGVLLIPESFNQLARSVVSSLAEKLEANEVRAMAANVVASPLLQV